MALSIPSQSSSALGSALASLYLFCVNCEHVFNITRMPSWPCLYSSQLKKGRFYTCFNWTPHTFLLIASQSNGWEWHTLWARALGINPEAEDEWSGTDQPSQAPLGAGGKGGEPKERGLWSCCSAAKHTKSPPLFRTLTARQSSVRLFMRGWTLIANTWTPFTLQPNVRSH
jgi:hypothetical protein